MIKFATALPIKIYRTVISPWLAPRCRYVPTCSCYAETAVKSHGFIKGGCLALLRLLRCHPWAKRDRHDPVPQMFAWGDIFRYKRCKGKMSEK